MFLPRKLPKHWSKQRASRLETGSHGRQLGVYQRQDRACPRRIHGRRSGAPDQARRPRFLFFPFASSPTTHALIPAQQSFSSAGSQTTTPSACHQLGGSWLSEILALDFNYPTGSSWRNCCLWILVADEKDFSKKVAQSYGLGHLGFTTPT